MTAAKLLSMPYRVARIPLGVLDSTVVQRLPERFPPRMMFDAVVGTADLVAGRVLHDPDLQSAASARLHAAPAVPPADGSSDASEQHARSRPAPTPEPAPEPADAPPPEVRQAARQARAADTKSKQHAATRANKNLATIRQQVAQTEAVAEAREHIAEQGGEQAADSAQAVESAQLTDS